jgi:hypothetical protein
LTFRIYYYEIVILINIFRDVSGVELLMNNHQSLKAEIDTREDNFTACISLGKELLSRNHYASNEVNNYLIYINKYIINIYL